MRFVIDQVLALSDGGGWLAGGIDQKRIGAQGLSLGGLTTLLVSYNPQLRDRRIRAAFAMAPASCELTRKTLLASRPLLLIDGDQDLITPIDQNAELTFTRVRMPRTLMTLAHATHTAFSGLVSMDSPVSYDAALGCRLVESITQQQVDQLIAAFGPAAAGTDTTGCDLPCKGPVPSNPPDVRQPAARPDAGRRHGVFPGAVPEVPRRTLLPPEGVRRQERRRDGGATRGCFGALTSDMAGQLPRIFAALLIGLALCAGPCGAAISYSVNAGWLFPGSEASRRSTSASPASPRPACRAGRFPSPRPGP